MIHLGDITKINGAEIPPVDIICGGSPCQDLSVAGKREGLAGERSGLYMEQIRVIKEMREYDRNGTDEYFRLHPRPRYMLWENVPGALSSGDPKGEDFRIVLEEAARVIDQTAVIPRPDEKWTNAGAITLDKGSLAWRITDAQWWGVPQRRRRIALLCDFDGFTASDILFEPVLRRESETDHSNETLRDFRGESRRTVSAFPEGLPRHLEQSGQAREGLAEGTEGCPDGASYTLKIRGGV